MTAELALKKFTSLSASVGGRMKTAGDAVSKVLFFSLADESIMPQKRICISLEKGLFSYAAGTRFLGRTTIRTSKTYPVENESYPTPEQFASSLAFDLSGQGGLGSPVTLSIPKAWTIIKTADFPATVKENLSEVITFEFDRITPLNPSETYFDYRIIREDSQSIRVVVMAARSDVIAPYLDALREQRITVDRIICSLEGLPHLLQKDDLRPDLIMIDVSDRSFDGAVFREGQVTGSFSGTFTAPEEADAARMISEAISHHHEQLAAQGASPEAAVLLRKPNPRLRQLLTSQRSLIPRIIESADAPEGISGGSAASSPASTGGLLQSLLPRRNGMNLLSRGVRTPERKPFIATVLLAAILLSMIAAYGVIPLQIEEGRLAEIDRQIAQRKDEVRKVEALKKEMEAVEEELGTIRDFRERRPLTLLLLKELTSVIPKNAWLTRIKVGEKSVEIEGYSSNATELLGKLESSAYFEKVEFSSPTFRDARQNADKFSIRMALEKADSDEE